MRVLGTLTYHTGIAHFLAQSDETCTTLELQIILLVMIHINLTAVVGTAYVKPLKSRSLLYYTVPTLKKLRIE